jgi:hypothetical protein
MSCRVLSVYIHKNHDVEVKRYFEINDIKNISAKKGNPEFTQYIINETVFVATVRRKI